MLRRFVVLAGLVPMLVGMGLDGASATQAPRKASSAPTVEMSYYDGHLDAIVTTDSSGKAQAKHLGINYSPMLAALKPKVFPPIFIVKGAAASGQLMVLGAEPGEDTYSPVWNEVFVTWSSTSTPVLLTSDTQIDTLAASGDLTKQRPGLLLNSAVIAENVADGSTVAPPTVFETFYDGHKDGMLATDVSTKPQAKAENINYSAVLATLDSQVFPEIYIVRGTMADGQLMILGSEPGESNYSPLWVETIVRWKKGVTPTVIKSDTQVDRLIEAGKVTESGTTVLLNCPVTDVAGTPTVGTTGAATGAPQAGSRLVTRPAAAVAATTATKVKIVDFAFSPKAITISKGTRIKWVNRGAVSHTSTSNTGIWDSGTIAPGGSFSRVFRKAGTFLYHCSIHPTMKAKIIVK